ncbi:hypothetical protein ECEC1864_4443, partial [Escherichia coli EC1864]
KPRLAI